MPLKQGTETKHFCDKFMRYHNNKKDAPKAGDGNSISCIDFRLHYFIKKMPLKQGTETIFGAIEP